MQSFICNSVNKKNQFLLRGFMETVVQNDMYLMIKRAVSEAIKEERMNLYFSLLPEVDDEEMKDIISQQGGPQKNNEYEDLNSLIDAEN